MEFNEALHLEAQGWRRRLRGLPGFEKFKTPVFARPYGIRYWTALARQQRA
jgi:hypothetical protein